MEQPNVLEGQKGGGGSGAQTHKTRPSAHMSPRRLGIQRTTSGHSVCGRGGSSPVGVPKGQGPKSLAGTSSSIPALKDYSLTEHAHRPLNHCLFTSAQRRRKDNARVMGRGH